MALVVFLRGVNVGGHRVFRPSVLAAEMKEFGLINIGAAGTFVARKPVSMARLRSELVRRLPFETEVIICTGREIREACSNHPFGGEPLRPDIVRFVSVLAKRPQKPLSLPIRIPEDGRWLVKIESVHGRFIYGVYRREMKAITYLGGLDKLFQGRATARNWNTMAAILKLLENGNGSTLQTAKAPS